MRHGRLAVAVVLGVLALASRSPAAEPCREHAIGLAVAAPTTLGSDASPAEVIAAAASTLRDKLDLPLSPGYTAYV
ncbi:MAG: hypothetical protein ACREKH_19285, partial [Candidatus Rokuibacteriota bacterium]